MTKTYHAHLVEMADGWQEAQDGLSPAQVRAFIEMADNLSNMIDGPVTAEFVVGVMHGIALHSSMVDIHKLPGLFSAILPQQENLSDAHAALVAGCLAARLLEGVYQP